MDIIGIIAALMMIFNNLYLLIIARAISGIAVGFNASVVTVYIKEYSPITISGLTGSMF